MAWGEPMGPSVVQAAKRLADAVRAWEANRSSNNTEAMVAARKEFDRLMEIAE